MALTEGCPVLSVLGCVVCRVECVLGGVCSSSLVSMGVPEKVEGAGVAGLGGHQWDGVCVE